MQETASACPPEANTKKSMSFCASLFGFITKQKTYALQKLSRPDDYFEISFGSL